MQMHRWACGPGFSARMCSLECGHWRRRGARRVDAQLAAEHLLHGTSSIVRFRAFHAGSRPVGTGGWLVRLPCAQAYVEWRREVARGNDLEFCDQQARGAARWANHVSGVYSRTYNDVLTYMLRISGTCVSQEASTHVSLQKSTPELQSVINTPGPVCVLTYRVDLEIRGRHMSCASDVIWP